MRLHNLFAASLMLAATLLPPSLANARNNVFVTSKCNQEFSMMVRHATANKTWTNSGWWEFKPGESAYLASNNIKITHLFNHQLYFYAQSDSGTWQGDISTQFKGKRLQLREAKVTELNDGDSDVVITCE